MEFLTHYVRKKNKSTTVMWLSQSCNCLLVNHDSSKVQVRSSRSYRTVSKKVPRLHHCGSSGENATGILTTRVTPRHTQRPFKSAHNFTKYCFICATIRHGVKKPYSPRSHQHSGLVQTITLRLRCLHASYTIINSIQTNTHTRKLNIQFHNHF